MLIIGLPMMNHFFCKRVNLDDAWLTVNKSTGNDNHLHY